METAAGLRIRWAAIGAAIAVALGAGGLGLVSATNPSDASALVAITPCRLTDTRTATQVGPRATPLGADETYTIDAHGTHGDCTIPASAVALSLNVTAVQASRGTFLTVWGEGPRPTAASLNPDVGQGPVPNAVTTPLDAAGRFNVFNAFGNVGIVIDVVGYYSDHDHDDRYYAKDETYSADQADERFVARASGPIRPHSLDYHGEEEWEFSAGRWIMGGPTFGCIRAPLDIPDGATVSEVVVNYDTISGATLTVSIISFNRLPGPIPNDQTLHHLYDTEVVPIPVGAVIGSLAFTHDPTEFEIATGGVGAFDEQVASTDRDISLAVCANGGDNIGIISVDVSFAGP